jgi:hypothetical protein
MAKPIHLATALRQEAARREALQPRLKSGVHARVTTLAAMPGASTPSVPPPSARPSSRPTLPEMHPLLIALEPRRKAVLARTRASAHEGPPFEEEPRPPRREPTDDSDTTPSPPPVPIAKWYVRLGWAHLIGGSAAILGVIAVVTYLASW